MPWYIVTDGDFDYFDESGSESQTASTSKLNTVQACMVQAWRAQNAVSSAADLMKVKQNARLHVRLASEVEYVGTVTVTKDSSSGVARANRRHKIIELKESQQT